jgi:Flp pilus assembly protein TadG
VGDRWHDESGNTLALFPAAVMVMFVLASMAIDAALTFSAQRQLADIAAAAANDAASAFSDETYFVEGEVVLDPVRVQDRVAGTLARRSDADELHAACTASLADGGAQVVVDCSGQVRQLISPVRFLGITSRDIGARATARPVAG